MVIVLVVANAGDVSTDCSAAERERLVEDRLGLYLVVLGFRQLRNRPAPGEEATMPGWMTTVDSFTPVKALGAGFVLSALNPKNLVLTIGSATTLAQAGLSGKKDAVVVAFFVIVSTLTVGGAVLFYLVGGQRAKTRLDAWKVWLAREQRSRHVRAPDRHRRRAGRQGLRRVRLTPPCESSPPVGQSRRAPCSRPTAASRVLTPSLR